MTIYHSMTLQRALHTAIKAQREIEKGYGYTGPSIELACWEQMLKELQAGEQIEVKHES